MSVTDILSVATVTRGPSLSFAMRVPFGKRQTKTGASSAPEDRSGPDRKDVLAFIIATYQLFLPLVIALIVVGAIVVIILIYIR